VTDPDRAGIRLGGVCKAFSGRPVLRGVDLDIAAGELAAVMGANGAGKSTLLRILATTVLPDSGRVLLGGSDVTRDPAAARRQIGVCLSEERSWYSQLSGRRNLDFFAALQGFRRAERHRRVEATLNDIGLGDAADRAFATYSTGMRLRLALGRALLHEPQVLLLDEPTRSLDQAGAESFVDRLVHSAHEDGRAIFMITHDSREAARADTVAVLRDGVIEGTTGGSEGPPLAASG
jgi:ABC-type multidrug transport system ATPase subunit